jgi:energy-coupling factor transporter ATP-binding protein EcfA2
MPRPDPNAVPENQNWRFIQRSIANADLIALARNIVDNDGNDLDDSVKTSILSFLPQIDLQHWSDLWVTIINTLGIGYFTSDNKVHKTKLAEYLANGGNPNEFYLLWSLLFQFPFAQLKHKEYKEAGIVVNPCQIIIESLLALFEISRNTGDKNPFREAYLTAEEIALVLMKSTSNDTYEVIDKVNNIYQNRVNSFDYNTIKIQGHDTIISNLVSRARLYYEKSEIISFSDDNSKILIKNWTHYVQCLNYLCYRKNGLRIDIQDEERNRIFFFEWTFNHSINPKEFFRKVHSFDRFINEANVEIDEVKALTNKLLAKGYHFTDSFVERFLLSAKTKPFLILSGISGVGKSLLPKALMRILENNDSRPIAVSPDWTDNSDMLGYFGADEKFVSGEFTNIVLEASKNLHLPYFIVLDEMNLAKVEYYFAQVLSVMESRYFDPLTGATQYHEYLFNIGTRERLAKSQIDSEKTLAHLKVPQNLVIVGTVNVDESTHPFSKKVLDRANVLEINEVNLRIGLAELTTAVPDGSIIPNSKKFVGTITNLNELHRSWKLNIVAQAKFDFDTYINRWIGILEEFNKVLVKHHLNFGLRMRDEVCIYLYYAALRNLDNPNSNWDNKYIDHQLVQKVLTRLEGEEGELEPSIQDLFKLCLNDPTVITSHQSIINYDFSTGSNMKYPITAKKLKSMLYGLVVSRKPMVSFWTS